jgi:uncharacterized membrane protein YhaH (DUF805 family)
MNSLFTAIKKLITINGVVSRSQFLGYTINLFVIMILGIVINYTIIKYTRFKIIFVQYLYMLLMIPTAIVSFRRINDTGKSKWYIFVPFYNIYLAYFKKSVKKL